MNVPAKFEVCIASPLASPEIIAIGVLVGVVNPQSWRRGGHRFLGFFIFLVKFHI